MREGRTAAPSWADGQAVSAGPLPSGRPVGSRQPRPAPRGPHADTEEPVLGSERPRDVLWKSSRSEDKEAEGQESPRDSVRAGAAGTQAGAQSRLRGGMMHTRRVSEGVGLFISFLGGGVIDTEHCTTSRSFSPECR